MSGTDRRATGKLKVIILPLTFHQALRHEDKPAKCSGARKCGLKLQGQHRGVSSLDGDSSGTGQSQGAACGQGTSSHTLLPFHPGGNLPRSLSLTQRPSCCSHGTQDSLSTTPSGSSCPFSCFPSTGLQEGGPRSYFLLNQHLPPGPGLQEPLKT